MRLTIATPPPRWLAPRHRPSRFSRAGEGKKSCEQGLLWDGKQSCEDTKYVENEL